MSEILGTLVTNRYSEDSTNGIDGTWKTIICEIDSEGGSDASTTETATKCGTFVATNNPTNTVSGNGVADSDPSSSQATLLDLQRLVNNQTRVWFRRQNAAEPSSSILAGQVVNMLGQGRFTSARDTATEGDVVKFSWAFAFSGDVSVDPDS